MFKFLIDANLSGAIPVRQLIDSELKFYLFYDLMIRREESDDVVAKIAYSHKVCHLITDDLHFGDDAQQAWRRLKHFALIVPSHDLILSLYLNPSEDFLNEFVSALKQAYDMNEEFFVIELRRNTRPGDQIIEVVGREPRLKSHHMK